MSAAGLQARAIERERRALREYRDAREAYFIRLSTLGVPGYTIGYARLLAIVARVRWSELRSLLDAEQASERVAA